MVARLSSFFADVLGTLVAGLSTASSAVVTAADSVLSAIGKLQAQINTIPAGTDIGRNLLLNGMFRVQQRGAGPFTVTTAFTADRWQLVLSGDSNSVTVVALADAARTAIGDESAAYALQNVVVGSGTPTTNFSQIVQRVEDLRRTAGRTVTVSFWALGSASLNIGLRLAQNFGTGGSPSAQVIVGSGSVPVTTTWTRFSGTIAVPALTGKTLGTNGDHNLAVGFGFSSGTTNTSIFGVGVQSGTFTMWGVQLEFGSVATAFEKVELLRDLANCQRHFWKTFAQGTAPANAVGSGTGELNFSAGAAGAVTLRSPSYLFPVTMRATPAILTFNPVSANAQAYDAIAAADCSAVAAAASDHGVRFTATGAVGTAVNNLIILHLTAQADL
jgi:hypothetical protein